DRLRRVRRPPRSHPRCRGAAASAALSRRGAPATFARSMTMISATADTMTPYPWSLVASGAQLSAAGIRPTAVDLTANACSCRTYVPMIACILIPAFELRAALRARPGLVARPAALAPLPATEPLLGAVTAAA